MKCAKKYQNCAIPFHFTCHLRCERLTMSSKRLRPVVPTVDDVLFKARIIMESDPFKDRAPIEEDKAFRALFGCGPAIVHRLWILLCEHELVPEGGSMTHLLWTLMYAKTYGKWKTMRKIAQADPKTLRLWIGLFIEAIAYLEPVVVSLKSHRPTKQ